MSKSLLHPLGPLLLTIAALAPSESPASPTILYAQTNADTVADIYVQGNAPTCRPGAVSISQWFANKYASDGKDIPIAWNVGDFTGFYPANNLASQRGLTNAQYGGTAIQVQNGESGWQIETTTAAPADAGTHWLAGIIGAHGICDGNGASTKVKPFANPNTILTYSLDVQVPYSNDSAGSVNTAAQMFYFIDPTVPPAGLGFWYSFSDYSSVDQTEQVIYDEGTSSAIVGAFPGTPGRYSIDIGGSSLRRAPWKGYTRFNVAMTAVNLRNAVDGLKAAAKQHPDKLSKYLALSSDPSVYQIGGGIFDTEVARVNGNDGGMGLSSRNAVIALYTGGAGCGPSNTQLAWSCGSGRPNAAWNDVGGGCYQYDSGKACHDRIVGQVDAVTSVGGAVHVTGWTCALGSPQALGVNIYAGGAPIGGGAAWNASEAAAGQSCLDPSGSPHRFAIVLDAQTAAAHRGQTLSVFGIYGSQSGALEGQFTVP